MQRLEITRPDDWHAHLRDGLVLGDTVRDMARYFGRVIVMPNLVPPVTTTAQACAYHERLQEQMPSARGFQPLMTLYLTDNTSANEIRAAKASGKVFAAKLYPAGATTNSASGVTDLHCIYPALEALQETGMPLLVHGEVTDADIDIFDREKVFIERHLRRLVTDFPGLKLVMEHITTRDAAEFVAAGADTLAATITPQHLLFNRNDLLVGGIRPHLFCLPVLKRNIHQQALLKAATSGSPKFFLGTDSAPHARDAKETACGCAGCYSATAAIELYAEAFEQQGALDKLEGFASHYGADFYGLPRNSDSIVLEKQPWQQADTLSYGNSVIVPLGAGETLSWRVTRA
ncbi:dihydroorotase [Motiliproteus sediminis]|uniref:dihydroorotase n=1 Tax=Motiliproteus sediminis TaxID=1468178 RepID=UPI001AEFF7AE|nr:dihydroorotase [Motiliproteus sediminis]